MILIARFISQMNRQKRAKWLALFNFEIGVDENTVLFTERVLAHYSGFHCKSISSSPMMNASTDSPAFTSVFSPLAGNASSAFAPAMLAALLERCPPVLRAIIH
jgi:hypothetical protein